MQATADAPAQTERPVDAFQDLGVRLTPDGGVLRRYVAGPVLWGAIVPVGMVSREAGGRMDERATHRITLRARPALDPAMRLAAGPRRFAIRTVTDPDDRGRDLVCHVEELTREASP